MTVLALRAELDLATYNGMTDQQAADELNAVDKTFRLLSMSGGELFAQTDATEYDLLSDTKKAQWLSLCALTSVDPSGVVESIVTDIWGASTTLNNLATARDVLRSQAFILGLGTISPENVRFARI